MKKYQIICLILCTALLVGMLPQQVRATETTQETADSSTTDQTEPPYEVGTGDSSVVSGSHSLYAQIPVWGSDKLLDTAKASILYELNSDTLVYAWNPDVQLHPASLVKIMTCLLALENCELTEKVTVTSTAIATLPKDTTLNFKIGEIWTMEQMLYCMMVGGYNDASVVIAEHVAGSQKAFVNMMNSRAKEIGCEGTVFTNATGFHNTKQLSTTRDLVKILKEALYNPEFKKFFSETVYRLPATDMAPARYMETTNYMMTQTITQEYYDLRVTGGRTGVTEDRERCIIVTAESKGMSYIAIVMCAKATYDDEGNIVRFGSYEEAKVLLKKAFDGHQITQVLGENQILTQYPVVNGENSVTVGPSDTAYTILPIDVISTDLSFRYQQMPNVLTAPIRTGEYVTTVQVWYGDVCVAQSPVVTRNGSNERTIEDQSVMIEQNTDGAFILLRVFIILAGVALAICCIIYLVGVARRASRRAKHNRRRRSRRRTK